MHELNAHPTQTFVANYKSIQLAEKQKSLTIEGNISDPKSNDPVFSDVISLYKVGSNQFVKASCKSGNVEIPIQDFTGSGQYQIFNMNPFQTTIPAFELIRTGEKLLDIEANPISRNTQIDHYVKDVARVQKVQGIFNPGNTDSIQRISSGFIPFEPDKVYLMEKYHKINTLEEFFREVVSFARVKMENELPTVRLKNRETNREFMEKPWYLVDGYLTRDEEKVLSIPFKNLFRIEIFETNKSIFSQLDAIMIRGGLVVVYTDNNYMKSTCEQLENIFDFRGFHESRKFNPVTKSESNFREHPDFRYQLYWNPDVNVGESTTISFQTSDLTGEYSIQVAGISENGKPISTSRTFMVEF